MNTGTLICLIVNNANKRWRLKIYVKKILQKSIRSKNYFSLNFNLLKLKANTFNEYYHNKSTNVNLYHSYFLLDNNKILIKKYFYKKVISEKKNHKLIFSEC